MEEAGERDGGNGDEEKPTRWPLTRLAFRAVAVWVACLRSHGGQSISPRRPAGGRTSLIDRLEGPCSTEPLG